jgi:type I restriction enzyme S subunit
MKSRLSVSPNELRLVEAILGQQIPDREVVAFGSRAAGKPKKMSDLDLCVLGEKLPGPLIEQLRESFSHSTLPFKVDLVEWQALPPEFRRVVGRDAVPVQRGTRTLRDD